MKAEYVDHLGDDLRVVNAARVSFDKAVEVWDEGENYLIPSGVDRKKYTAEDNKKLIRYLATHGHWTPFSHAMITVRETVPIFVARQRFKHMVGFTYNEVSRRYVDDEPDFYVPEVWRSRPDGSVKQGSGGEEVKATVFGTSIRMEYDGLLAHCERLYNDLIDSGVAPEQARMVLPQSMYTSYYTTGSLAAFARAYRQRVDAHAQVEIQDLAKQWDTIIRPLFPVSWEALTE